MQEVTIAEAAKRLGMSIDSIRRRIAKEELKAHKVPSPHGEIYMVELPDDVPPIPAIGENKEEESVAVEAMRKTISILEAELDARRREVQELHVLLQQAQKQLTPGKTENTPKETPMKVSWWRRLFVSEKHQSNKLPSTLRSGF
jgi:DNA-binding transcriptional MerR regulator